MAIQLTAIIFDELASDPGAPAEGQLWFNTTTHEFKGYLNGGIQVIIDKAVFDAHANSVLNPHATTLEKARSAGAVLSGAIDMGGNAISNVGSVGAGYDAASETYVVEQINARIRGLDWQDSVLDKDLVTAPALPSGGDRYIIAGTGGLWSPGTIGDIAEYDGAAWVFSTPNEGFACTVEDEGIAYVYSGVSWGAFGTVISHGDLLNKGADDHTQYLLVNGTRAMTGALDMGAFSITNVGTVDGVTVGDHDARHERAGADEIDGDHLGIDFTPANYTPSIAPAEAAHVDDLAAHLKGIDDELAATTLPTKAGRVAVGSFAGNPKLATVTFATPFPGVAYAIVLTAVTQNNKQYVMNAQSKLAASFVINMGTNNVGDLLEVGWTATADGETA